jgi:hypothetical protein
VILVLFLVMVMTIKSFYPLGVKVHFCGRGNTKISELHGLVVAPLAGVGRTVSSTAATDSPSYA